MSKVTLRKVEPHFQELLKDKGFKKLYEIERAKVALAQKIAMMREEKNLKQSELAKKMRVSQQFISQIETGEQKNLTLDTLVRIARSLNRSVKISFPKISRQGHNLVIE